ncbi:MAG: 3-oxoacyl-ACP reductase FabG [Dehalococcoidia bacterium]|nr:3-oxoacyl-ACP reductase FabG [Dehalococcoidia bacterium]
MGFLPVELKGRVAVVTGGNSGIGRGIAAGLASAGCSVVVAARNEAVSREAARELADEYGVRTLVVALDVKDVASTQRMADEVVREFGRIDILVNNAGVTGRASLTEMSEETWDHVVDTNLKGVFFCIQAAAKHMMAQRYGKIVNISSIAGLGWTDVGGINYGASKAAITQLTKGCARSLGPFGINVNTVAPGSIDTPILAVGRTPEQVQAYKENAIGKSAIGRLGLTEDIANAVLFLASDYASFIDGQTIAVDGGRFDLM